MNNTTNKKTWFILGAGAIGCLWASYWRQSGFDVILITRNKHQSKTLTLTAGRKDHVVDVQTITIEELQTSSQTIHHLLVSTKAQNTINALNSIRLHINDNASMIILQNGMASIEVKREFPNHTIFTAITTDGAYRTESHCVTHAGKGITYIDCDAGFLELLPQNFLAIKNCEDIEIRQWKKLAINCCVNGLTAIYHCRNGELLSSPEAMQRISSLCEEVITVVTALGMGKHFIDLQKQIEYTLQTTADNFSSMYQDIENQQESEIDMLNGFLCRQANELNLPHIENQKICDEINQKQSHFKHSQSKQSPSNQ